MAGALPHYKTGPATYTAGGLILGGQLVVPASGLSGSLAALNGVGVLVCPTSTFQLPLGVAGADANTGMFPEGTASLPGVWPGDSPASLQDQLLDNSILGYSVPVWNNVDIPVNYDGSGAVVFGQYLTWSTTTAGAVKGLATGAGIADASLIIGRCTQPGGVTAVAQSARAFIRV